MKRRDVRRQLIEEEMIRVPVQKAVVVEQKERKDKEPEVPKERKKPGRKKGWKKALENSSAVDHEKMSAMCGRGKGSIPMSIPEMLMPEFCRRISAEGTRARLDVINGFARDYPETSIRQATMKFIEITTRDKPTCIAPPGKATGRAILFYLRPRFYHMLDESDRPDNWKEVAREDEIKWQEEREAKAKAKARNEQTIRGMKEDKSVASDDEAEDFSVSEVNTSVLSTMETTMDTDEEDERPVKKQKSN